MPKLIDETGNKYGRLTVLYRAQIPKKGVYWHCRCDCGNEIDVFGTSLRCGNTKSCGCLKHERIIQTNIKRGVEIKPGDRYGALTVKEVKPYEIYCKCDCGKERWVKRANLVQGHTTTCGCGIGITSPNYIDETGNRYGRFTVIEDAGRDKNGRVLWKCKCDCGNEKIALGKSLRAGLIQSCGCLHSLGEQKINNILTQLHINFIPQKSFDDLKSNLEFPLFFDFYLIDYNTAIEYQGEQHYRCNNRGWNNPTHLQQIQERDELKRQYCKKHNITLIEIPYTDFKKINEEYILNLLEANNENNNH